MLNPEQTVIDFVEAWNRMDFDHVYALMAEDIVYHNMPYAPIIGVAAARAFFESWPVEAIDWTIVNIATNGKIVLTERIDRFLRNEGELSIPVMGTFQVEQGLITHWRDYFDSGALSNYKPRTEAVGWASAHRSD
jgi:limonene-1,2-epoxide hydrolase